MARSRAFDNDEVLDAAIECFWRRGLAATSVRDLASEMGINVPSLYNAFGDKRRLFAEALERYAQQSMRERISRIETKYAGSEAIEAFFKEVIARSLSDPDRRGCLIVNSALEVAPHDKELQLVIAAYMAEIESFFRRCLEASAREGGLTAATDTADMSRLFLGILLGIRVASRANPQRALLEGMVRPALALLELRHSQIKKEPR